MKNICVFCGSSLGFDKRFAEAARRLADVLADNECVLYYGGGNVGIMKTVADRMIERGMKVVGVMPDFLLAHEIGHPDVTEMIPTKTMAERKEILLRDSDAFIALAGGFGTLDELSEVIVADQLHLMEKPVALYNTLGYYDGIVQWVERGVKEGYIRQEHYNNLIVSDDPAVIFRRFKEYKPVRLDKWIKDIKEEMR